MEMFLNLIYVVKLSSQELALIGRALRGTLKDSDSKTAKELCDRLAQSRASLVQDQLKKTQKLLDNLAIANHETVNGIKPESKESE